MTRPLLVIVHFLPKRQRRWFLQTESERGCCFLFIHECMKHIAEFCRALGYDRQLWEITFDCWQKNSASLANCITTFWIFFKKLCNHFIWPTNTLPASCYVFGTVNSHTLANLCRAQNMHVLVLAVDIDTIVGWFWFVVSGTQTGPQWTSTHQRTIHWMPLITQLWINWVSIWVYLGNQLWKKNVSDIDR